MPINWLSGDSLHRDVIDIIERVQRDQMTPEEAEEWALKNERAPFVAALDTGLSCPIEEPYWPIPLAVAWITAREPETAVRSWRRQKFWGRALRRTEPWRNAAQDLWRQLMAGTITATGIKDGASERMTISPIEWNDLTWDRKGQVERISFRHDPSPRYREVRLHGADVRALWKPESVAVTKAKSTAAAEARCKHELIAMMRGNRIIQFPKPS